jgi:hypothetical protein
MSEYKNDDCAVEMGIECQKNGDKHKKRTCPAGSEYNDPLQKELTALHHFQCFEVVSDNDISDCMIGWITACRKRRADRTASDIPLEIMVLVLLVSVTAVR